MYGSFTVENEMLPFLVFCVSPVEVKVQGGNLMGIVYTMCTSLIGIGWRNRKTWMIAPQKLHTIEGSSLLRQWGHSYQEEEWMPDVKWVNVSVACFHRTMCLSSIAPVTICNCVVRWTQNQCSFLPFSLYFLAFFAGKKKPCDQFQLVTCRGNGVWPSRPAL